MLEVSEEKILSVQLRVSGYSLDSNDMSTEAEGSPLLEAVTTECLVETVAD
jgi:hypothetical protein